LRIPWQRSRIRAASRLSRCNPADLTSLKCSLEHLISIARHRFSAIIRQLELDGFSVVEEAGPGHWIACREVGP
jgi:hypothetical protein